MSVAHAARDRARLWQLLGVQAPSHAPPSGALVDTTVADGIRVERWHLGLDATGIAPALLVQPAYAAPRAIVLYQHAHGHRFDVGKDELVAGRPSLLSGAYATPLVERGFAALAIDHRGFGERAQETERALFKRWLWQGVSLLGLRIADSIAAVSWLRARPRWHALPLVASGISMGGTLACWSAALDPRIDAVVDVCSLAEFDALLDTGGFDHHAEYFFVAGLAREFSASRISALIAPRPHLSLAGRDDPLTPPAGLASVDTAMRIAYARANAPHAWRQRVHDCGHVETAAMRSEVLSFLDAIAGQRPAA